MEKFFFFLFIYIWLSGFVFAQEEAKYNFGSSLGEKNLTAAPGKEVNAVLYFYNVFGNRITHVSLAAVKAPKNWEIKIFPTLETVKYDVAGVEVEVEENLFIEPDEIVNEIPAETGEFTYISAPNVGGFIPAKAVLVKIKVPASEKLGKTFIVRIDAEAQWLGQTGTAALKQTRSFDYNISTVAEKFYERKISPEEIPTKPKALQEIVLYGANAFFVFVSSPSGLILIAVIALIAIYVFKKRIKQ